MQSSHVETRVQNQSKVWKKWDHSREWWEQIIGGGLLKRQEGKGGKKGGDQTLLLRSQN